MEIQLLEGFPKVVVTAAKFDEPEWSPPLYNIWTFRKNTSTVTHFGNSAQEIAVDLRRRGAYWTLEKVGEALGVGRSTVMRWIPDPTFANAKVDEPVKTTGKDGKSRPTTYKPRAKKSAVATNQQPP